MPGGCPGCSFSALGSWLHRRFPSGKLSSGRGAGTGGTGTAGLPRSPLPLIRRFGLVLFSYRYSGSQPSVLSSVVGELPRGNSGLRVLSAELPVLGSRCRSAPGCPSLPWPPLQPVAVGCRLPGTMYLGPLVGLKYRLAPLVDLLFWLITRWQIGAVDLGLGFGSVFFQVGAIGVGAETLHSAPAGHEGET